MTSHFNYEFLNRFSLFRDPTDHQVTYTIHLTALGTTTQKNHHIVPTNLRLSCTFAWTGAQLSEVANVPIRAAEKIKSTCDKYIGAVQLDGFGMTSLFALVAIWRSLCTSRYWARHELGIATSKAEAKKINPA